MLSAYRGSIVDSRTPQLFRKLQLLTFGELSKFRKLCERHAAELGDNFGPVNFGLSWLTSAVSHARSALRCDALVRLLTSTVDALTLRVILDGLHLIESKQIELQDIVQIDL